MTIQPLSAGEVSSIAVRTLGLDDEAVDLTSNEGLAHSLRRAASFMCPTSPRSLVDSVLTAIKPLVPDNEPGRDELADLVDLLIAVGDLLELRHDIEGRMTRLLYLGPPAYIEREPGIYLLAGIRPFGEALLTSDLSEMIEYESHTRCIRFADNAIADERLSAAGLRRMSPEVWVSSPRREDASAHVDRMSERLNAAGPSGEIEGLQILDPTTSVRYYKGRWRAPISADHGDFVGRRPQAYGADLWSMVRLERGTPIRLVEFPIEDPVVPARDEAWRMQLAIDSCREFPQRFSTEPSAGQSTLIRFYSPIPGFAEKYLQLKGLPVGPTKGALIAFRVPNGTLSDLESFLTDLLWMRSQSSEGDQ